MFLQYSSFKAAFEGLREAGYLEVTKGGFIDRSTGEGRVTRTKATERLIRLLTNKAKLTIPAISSRVDDDREFIILRDKDKRNMEYEDTAETNTMRLALRRINAQLQKQWIDIHIPDSEFRELQQRMQRDYDQTERERPFIDFTQRTLVRIFNNGDWKQGGRFYRGWWQAVPKTYRRFITIDQKRTVEIDFSGLHPELLYAYVGKKLEGEPYHIGRDDIPRDLIKKTFNAMINARGSIRIPDDFDANRIGMTWKQFQEVIIARHSPIKDYFKAGFGLQLQRLDSDMAERIMIKFLEMGYSCLPIHDSFLVHHALADELHIAMKNEFKIRYGNEIDLDSTVGKHIKSNSDGFAETDIGELLNPTGEYADYEKRWLGWIEYRENSPEVSA